MPQWRGSRKTARRSRTSASAGRLPPPQWRGSRKTARSGNPRMFRPLRFAAPQWRGSRKTARRRISARLPSVRKRGRNGGAVVRLPGGLAPEPSRDLGFRQGLRAVLLRDRWQECIQLSRSRKSVVSQRFERWLVLQRSLDRSHQIITGPAVGSRFATPMNWKQSLPRPSGEPRSTIAIESRAW